MKKLFPKLLFVCALLAALVSFTEGTEYGRGDVNQDGKVTIDDVTCLINYLLTDTGSD